MLSSPSAETTLAVLLGASEFPKQKQLTPSKAFFQSAADLKKYLLSPEGLALSIENLLDLFDSDKDPNTIDEEVGRFLVSRQTDLKTRQLEARDVIIYYVGHGGFASPGDDYFLALRSTRSGNELISSYAITTLANTLREYAPFLRRYLILDSCFSAAAYASFQSPPLEVAKRKTLEEFPGKGTALLCAAGPRDPAKSLPGQVHTMFSGALLYVLEKGSKEKPDKLSFFDIGELTSGLIKERFPDKAVRPELHSPDQKQGDVVVIPFFPNPARNPQLAEELRQKLTALSDDYEELKKRYHALETSGPKSNKKSTTQPAPRSPLLKPDIVLPPPMAVTPSTEEFESNRKMVPKSDRSERGNLACNDLIAAAKVLQSGSVRRCAIEFVDGTALRFLSWLFFPPRTLLLGEAFEGELRFQDCLPSGAWTDDVIQIAHSIIRDGEGNPSLQLTTEYVWSNTGVHSSSRLDLAELTTEPRAARLVQDGREEPLEAARRDMPTILRLGEEPKTLLLPSAAVDGRASGLRLRTRLNEPDLIIYQLQPQKHR